MANGVNKAIILGRLGQDPEIRYTKDGKAVTTLSVATSESWKDKQTGEKKEQTERQSIFQWGTETTANAYGVTINEQNTVTNYGWQADETSTTQYASTTNWDHYVVS